MSRRGRHKKNSNVPVIIAVVGVIMALVVAGPSLTGVMPVFMIALFVALVLGVGLFWWMLAIDTANDAQHSAELARYRNGLARLEFDQVDLMTGVEFEKYVGAALETRGFESIRYTAHSDDDGIDILARKGDRKYAVQAKRYSGKVGKQHIYPVDSAYRNKRYQCDEAMVVTNSYFTESARAYAESAGVVLVDRDVLAEWQNDVQTAQDGKIQIA